MAFSLPSNYTQCVTCYHISRKNLTMSYSLRYMQDISLHSPLFCVGSNTCTNRTKLNLLIHCPVYWTLAVLVFRCWDFENFWYAHYNAWCCKLTSFNFMKIRPVEKFPCIFSHLVNQPLVCLANFDNSMFYLFTKMTKFFLWQRNTSFLPWLLRACVIYCMCHQPIITLSRLRG